MATCVREPRGAHFSSEKVLVNSTVSAGCETQAASVGPRKRSDPLAQHHVGTFESIHFQSPLLNFHGPELWDWASQFGVLTDLSKPDRRFGSILKIKNGY